MSNTKERGVRHGRPSRGDVQGPCRIGVFAVSLRVRDRAQLSPSKYVSMMKMLMMMTPKPCLSEARHQSVDDVSIDDDDDDDGLNCVKLWEGDLAVPIQNAAQSSIPDLHRKGLLAKQF